MFGSEDQAPRDGKPVPVETAGDVSSTNQGPDADEAAFLAMCPAIEKAVRDLLREQAAEIRESGVRLAVPYHYPVHLG